LLAATSTRRLLLYGKDWNHETARLAAQGLQLLSFMLWRLKPGKEATARGQADTKTGTVTIGWRSGQGGRFELSCNLRPAPAIESDERPCSLEVNPKGWFPHGYR
jgi:hypothetical protein